MKLINNDCIAAMKEMADDSVDSIVTDPPYELGFMGKSWDASGIAFNIEVWQEALRVLKPGGHLLAFSGSRTYHRMTVAIEDAGFEIRDQIQWIYGSGFPKSLDVSKAIDKSAGAEREIVGIDKIRGNAPSIMGKSDPTSQNYDGTTFGVGTTYITAPATAAAKQWQGWGTALKPAHEPIVLARKPLIGTVAANVLTHGTGGLNIDASRVPGVLEGDPNRFATTDGGNFNTSLALENHDAPIVRTEGRWPANVIHDGSDEVVALFPDTKPSKQSNRGVGFNDSEIYSSGNPDFDTLRGFGDSGSAARFFYCAKASKRDRNEGLDDFDIVSAAEMVNRVEDSAGMQNPRAGAGRTSGAANHHPTVKPTDLMRYLCRLVTPPAGIVLDPFMGSGSTGKAAMLEGFDFIGIDQSAEYVAIAQARIEHAVIQQMAGDKE
jgi:site-specific DNA-methyltransferase (adenine-specific)